MLLEGLLPVSEGVARDCHGQQGSRIAPNPRAPALAEWPESVRLAGERETLGLYLTGHPIQEYAQELKHLVGGRIADVTGGPPAGAAEGRWFPQKNVVVAGLVHEVRRRGNRTSLILDDRSGRLEVSLYDEVFQAHRDVVMKDAILVVEGGLRWDDFIDGWRLAAKKLTHVDVAREQNARKLLLRWPPDGDAESLLRMLEAVLRPVRGGRCGVAVHYVSGRAAAHAVFQLGADWCVRPTRAVLDEVAKRFGPDGWRLVYNHRDEQDVLAKWAAGAKLADLPLQLTG